MHTVNVSQTDFSYSVEELQDLEKFLDAENISYEIFEDDDDCYKAAFTSLTPEEMSKIITWELNYADSLI